MVSFNDFIIRHPHVYKRFTGKELTFLLMHKEVFIKNHSKQFTIVFTIIKQKKACEKILSHAFFMGNRNN